MPGKGKETRKVSHKGMSIPQLRRSFEHIQSFVKKTDYSLPEFRKEWEKTFHKSVSVPAAKDYLAYMKERNADKKTQEGGMAPLDYQLRPGVEGVYGNFPTYVTGGFGHFNHDSFRAGCGIEDISPRVPASMGSNLVSGGGLQKKKRTHQTKRKKQRGGASMFPMPSLSSAMSEFMQRPILSSSPPGILQGAQIEAKGGWAKQWSNCRFGV